MKLSQLSKKTIRARDLIGEFDTHLTAAKEHADMLISWIAPNGDMYLERKSVVDAIIMNGSWR